MQTTFTTKELFLETCNEIAGGNAAYAVANLTCEYTLFGTALEFGFSGTKELNKIAADAFIRLGEVQLGDGFNVVRHQDAVVYDYRVKSETPEIASRAADLLCSITVQMPNSIR